MFKKIIRWSGYNAVLASVIYFALVEGNIIAELILQGFVILIFVFSLLILNPNAVQTLLDNRENIAPLSFRIADVFVDSLFIIAMLLAGWMWIAFMYFFHIATLQVLLTEAVAKIKAEEAK